MPKPLYMKLDFDFFQDPKMLAIFDHYAAENEHVGNPDLMDNGAWETIGIYLGVCSIMQRFGDTGYRIPLLRLRQMATFNLHISNSRFTRHIDLLVEVGLLKKDSEYIWSPRRVGELKEQDELSRKRQEGAYKTNKKRWNYEGGVAKKLYIT